MPEASKLSRVIACLGLRSHQGRGNWLPVGSRHIRTDEGDRSIARGYHLFKSEKR